VPSGALARRARRKPLRDNLLARSGVHEGSAGGVHNIGRQKRKRVLCWICCVVGNRAFGCSGHLFWLGEVVVRCQQTIELVTANVSALRQRGGVWRLAKRIGDRMAVAAWTVVIVAVVALQPR
jgi:hypothetical protein